MSEILKRLDAIREELAGIRNASEDGVGENPDLEDLFSEIEDIADEIEELVNDAESIATGAEDFS